MRYNFTITITEHRRVGVVEADSRSEARRLIHAAQWDMDLGLTDPERFDIRINELMEAENEHPGS